MKAIVNRRYGLPEVMKLEEVPKPSPRDDEVLLEVRSASVNSWDWERLRGTPFANRIGGLFSPQYQILGADVAGRVEAVGSNARRFQPGDEVFGDLCGSGWGGFVEYVCARENALALKPGGLTFEEAAAVPQAAVMALQGLRDEGRIQPGQRVLINGAGGGVGTFAVQLAKCFGGEVTGVDSKGKLDKVRSIGADHVIDYAQEDFSKNGQRYDLILDVALHRSILACRRALHPIGTYVIVGGSTARILQAVFLAPWVSRTKGQRIRLLLAKANKNLAEIGALIEAGKVTPVIERRYPLREVPEAIRHFGEGRAIGKLVITI